MVTGNAGKYKIAKDIFIEKGLKGIFSWIITIILAIVVYGVVGAGLYFLLLNLEFYFLNVHVL